MHDGSAIRDLIHGFRPETVVGIEAVERALGLTGSGVGAKDVVAKGVRDVVTATDVAVEDAVRAVVRDTLGLPVVGEEGGGEAPADGSPYWIVDPICGTRNFASGIPLYCVNLALVEDGQVTVAVVGDPSTGEVDVVERGGSAWALKDGARRQLVASAGERDAGDRRQSFERRAPRAGCAVHSGGDPRGSLGAQGV